MSVQVNASQVDERTLKDLIESESDIEVTGCLGQRYLGVARKCGHLRITGTPGNGLASYLDGGEIYVHGNVQDAVADTMNDGFLAVDGNAGDALCYAMRGGSVFIRGNAGYRAGVHMKAYRERQSILVIGGRAGSFLGEYLAGGTIAVLGLDCPAGSQLTGYFCANGMYAGSIYLRTTARPVGLSDKLSCHLMDGEEKKAKLEGLIRDYASAFSLDAQQILSGPFLAIEADPHKSYRQLYATL